MLSFYDHAPLMAGRALASAFGRLMETVARLLQQTRSQPAGEALPPFRSLREDVGLLPLDREGLPM